MPNASFIQTSFLGGEWSSYSQGRVDSERYKTAMNRCFNGYPLEEGSWTRRQGTRNVAMTKEGGPAVLRPFNLSKTEPYQIELGEGYARYYRGPTHVYDGSLYEAVVTDITGDTPAVVTTSAAHNYSNGDTVVFLFDDDAPGNEAEPNGRFMRNRQFAIDNVTTDTFELYDPVTGDPIDGSTLQWTTGGLPGDDGQVRRISENVTPYTADDLNDIRIIQNDESAVLFAAAHPPQVVTLLEDGATEVPFAVNPAEFIDGPYLDIPDPYTVGEFADVAILTPDGTTGEIDISASSGIGINDGNGFQSTDVGRLIRLFWEPPLWDEGSSYAVGDLVKYNDGYYVNIVATGATTSTPEQNITSWAPATDAAKWTWGRITVVTDTANITVELFGPDLPDTEPIITWRLGLFSDTTGWPKFGTFHDGRLWLGGGITANRIDGSKANSLRGIFDFEPTLVDGTVADDNAIQATALAESRAKATWMLSDDEGIYVGTEAGEWRGRASATNDPISPTNFDFRRVSKVKCFNTDAVRAPNMTLLVQLTQRKIMEWGPSGGGRFSSAHLSVTGRHLTESGVAQIAYQADPVPMVWGRREDGVLIGAAYRRDEEAGYHAAWWKAKLAWNANSDDNELDLERAVTSISTGVSLGGLSEALWVVTRGPDVYYEQDLYMVEILTPVFEDDQEPYAQFFVDSGVHPQAGYMSHNSDDPEDPGYNDMNFQFHGLWNIRGQTVSIMLGGIDFGDYEVDENGSIFIEAADLSHLVQQGLTFDYVIGLDDTIYGDFGVTIGRSEGLDGTTVFSVIPVVIGLAYYSEGQILRPDFANDAGAANGPAFSKIRRVHKYSLHAHRTLGDLKVGVDFEEASAAADGEGSLRPAPLTPDGGDGRTLPLGELFTGIIRGTMDAGYDTEGKISWRIRRPYNLVITAVGGFLATQDE